MADIMTKIQIIHLMLENILREPTKRLVLGKTAHHYATPLSEIRWDNKEKVFRHWSYMAPGATPPPFKNMLNVGHYKYATSELNDENDNVTLFDHDYLRLIARMLAEQNDLRVRIDTFNATGKLLLKGHQFTPIDADQIGWKQEVIPDAEICQEMVDG